ncbi:TIGR01841 family phasin [Massilia sp. TS11]|uniref:TIGR01841 family phasin n=1 Tax=Massilia sp. TS11 TaxID=2908003 RepID=UPI001EDBC224|nr:TIGR01841 family phasin [Massilia sp. TS11]MCG2584197.1 TIGR01841 family phasin [Massilia sp. TS11]
MFTSPEQFANATKTLFELQMMTFNALAQKTIQGVEQVVALNVATAQSAMKDAMEASKELGRAPSAQAALTAMANLPPGMQNTKEYAEQLTAIILQMKDEFEQAADAHLKESKNSLSALIYDVTQHVKPGSKDAVQIVKAAIDNAFRGYEEVTRATREAVKMVEAQIEAAAAKVKV